MKGLITAVVALMLCMGPSMVTAENTDGKINLNKATLEQLMAIGLDKEVGRGIIDYRKENGEFVDIEELLDIDGMDPAILRQIKGKIYIEAGAGCNC